jgi:transcriptional regulator with XRE-family HTH domain
VPHTTAEIRRSHGRRITAARLNAGLTQRQLSAALAAAGIDTAPQTISLWENGANSPSPARMVALAGILGVRVGDLFDLDNVLPSASVDEAS